MAIAFVSLPMQGSSLPICVAPFRPLITDRGSGAKINVQLLLHEQHRKSALSGASKVTLAGQ